MAFKVSPGVSAEGFDLLVSAAPGMPLRTADIVLHDKFRA